MASRFLYKILWNIPRSFSQFYTKRCRQDGFVIDCHLLGTGSLIQTILKEGKFISFSDKVDWIKYNKKCEDKTLNNKENT